MKKVLGLSIAALLLIGLVVGGTFAYFSDTETSTPNTFTAGVIDLQIDSAGDTVFSAQDDPLPRIFDYLPANDIKPGDTGEVTLSMRLTNDSNNADLWMQITTPVDNGGLFPEPERALDPSNLTNDISNQITTVLWLDDGDNILNGSETPLYTGTLAGLASAGTAGKLDVVLNAVGGNTTGASTTYYVGWSWTLPTTVGNIYQGDFCTFNITFGADQIGMP